jgi:hypothetical protein
MVFTVCGVQADCQEGQAFILTIRLFCLIFVVDAMFEKSD